MTFIERFRIFSGGGGGGGGPRFRIRILGGGGEGPYSQQAHDVASMPFRRHVPTRFLKISVKYM